MLKPDFSSIAGFKLRIRQPAAAQQPVHTHPLLNSLYLARGIQHPNQLDVSLSSLLPFADIRGIDQAVDLLVTVRRAGQKVLVVGDYDADGATSTALAVLGLTAMGINAQYLLPNRFEYGYGLSPEIVDLALTLKPDVILTVDNGIASFAGVAKARAAGIKVLVTDHHLAADVLPDADAIVNPNQPGCDFISKAACGCTVLYYLLIALRSALRQAGELSLPNLGQWLDLVALATVADVVPLDENNRRLVAQGLQRVRAGRCRPGIRALFEVAGRTWQDARAADFGFVVGPRLNAAGRLDDMTIGVQLLLTEDEQEARQLAAQLHELNMERRNIEASMLADVESGLAQAKVSENQFSAVIYRPDWHEGVIGILASRVKDKLHRPVVAFAQSENGLLKGSARSVPGIHLRDAIDWVTKQQPHIVDKFGGHAMAAGLSIRSEYLADFGEWFARSVAMFADKDALTPHIWCDGQLPIDQLTLRNALQLEVAGPWGQGFPEPAFTGEWSVLDSRVLAEKHLKMILNNGGQELAAIAFNCDPEILAQPIDRVRGVYQLSCNRFRGNETLQLIFSKLEVLN